jgi:quercetin dioxygenase-like cupin family protein
MKTLNPRESSRLAISASPSRPATAVLHDSDDVRLVVFRLGAGQQVPPHRNGSSVMLTVLEGEGLISGEENGAPVEVRCKQGDVVTYVPNELHGMRAESGEFLLLATIAPRPGSR